MIFNYPNELARAKMLRAALKKQVAVATKKRDSAQREVNVLDKDIMHNACTIARIEGEI